VVNQDHLMLMSTREMLIATATDLFYQHGFHAVGLDQIITRVGVTKTTFYNHFESKDDLIIAVLHERDERERAEWMSIIQNKGGGDPKLEILALFDLLEEWLASPEFRGCMFMKASTEYPSPRDPVHQAAMVHGESLLREVRARAHKGGAADPDALAGQLMLLLTGAIVSRTARPEPDRGKAARAAAGVIVEASMPDMAPQGV
jgi:AcrR family transcriptional regulator